MISMLSEFLSHFPNLRAHFYPRDKDAPADACRALPLEALIAAAEAVANQWFGLLTAMNTAALSKSACSTASALLAQNLGSLAVFDAAAARQLRDGTITSPRPTNFERCVNFIRVGQIALDMTLALFIPFPPPHHRRRALRRGRPFHPHPPRRRPQRAGVRHPSTSRQSP